MSSTIYNVSPFSSTLPCPPCPPAGPHRRPHTCLPAFGVRLLGAGRGYRILYLIYRPPISFLRVHLDLFFINSQQHRTLQPTGPPSQGPSQPHTHPRLNEGFDIIRQEFDVLSADINVLRGQRDDYESKGSVLKFLARCGLDDFYRVRFQSHLRLTS